MSEELREAIETESWQYIEDDGIDISRDIDLAREIAFQEIYD